MVSLTASFPKPFHLTASCRYNTFSGYPPEIVKKMPKRDLAEEVIVLLISFLYVLTGLLHLFLYFVVCSLFQIFFHVSLVFHLMLWFLFQLCQHDILAIPPILMTIPLPVHIFIWFVSSQVWRLQAALGEQTEITKYSQEEYERLQNVIFQLYKCGYLVLIS